MQRHRAALGRGNRDVAHRGFVHAIHVRQAHAHRHRVLAFPQRGREFTGQRHFQCLLRGFHRYALACQRVAVELDMQLRRGRVAVQVQIHHALDGPHLVHGLRQNGAQLVDLGTEHLEHHLAARARSRFLNAVAYGLGEVEGHARNHVQLVAHLLDQRGLGQVLAPVLERLEADQRLGHVERLVVGARLGPALLGADQGHFGELAQDMAHFGQHLLALLQRDRRRHLHQHIGVALIELRQELGAQPGRRQAGHHQDHHRAHHHRALARDAVQRARYPVLVAVVHALEHFGLGLHHMLGLEQQRAQRGHQAQRKHQRAEQSEAVSHGQRTEDPAFDALQREHGNQRRDHDRHREQRGLGHGNRRLDDDGAHLALVFGPAQAGVADDVLRQHHRPVDHDAEVDRAHGDQVGGHSQPVQADEGHQQRQRNHRGDDQRAAQAAQHQPQHAHNQAGAKQQVVLHRGQRMADEIGAVVGDFHLHAFGQQAAIEQLDLLVQAVQHDGGVLAALEQHHALHHVVLVVHAHRALARRMRLDHAGDIAYGDGRAAAQLHHHFLDFLRRAQQAYAADDERLFTAAQQAAADVAVGLLYGLGHVGQRQAQAVELVGVHFDVVLLDEAAYAHHIGHALHLLERAHDVPFLLGAQLVQRVAVALEAVVIDLSQRRVVGRHLGRHARGQIGLGQALRDFGARGEAVCMVVEDHVDHGQAEVAFRTQRHQTRRAVELALQRLRDLAFDFLGREPRGLGNDAHLDVGHVGVGFDRGMQV